MKLEIKDAAALELQDFKFELKGLNDEGTFNGYASVFGVKDDGCDIMMKGAFAASIADIKGRGRKVPMLWAHNTREPIGAYTDMKEDDFGLYVEGKFTKGVARAAEIHALMKDGVIDGLSIGFRTKQYEIDTTSGVRKLKEVDLMEISVVTFPMLNVARTMGVKSDFVLNPRDLERELKEAGISGNDSVKAVAVMKKFLAREAPGIKTTPARDGLLGDVLKSLREARADISK